MSIELDNPKTVFEKIDAAANFVAQVRLAVMMQDGPRINELLDRTDLLLFDALRQLQEQSVLDKPHEP